LAILDHASQKAFPGVFGC